MPRHSLINAAIILCLTGSTALGHPGHGTAGDGSTPQHYLTEPAHIAQWIVVIAASMAISWFAAKWTAHPTKMESQLLSIYQKTINRFGASRGSLLFSDRL